LWGAGGGRICRVVPFAVNCHQTSSVVAPAAAAAAVGLMTMPRNMRAMRRLHHVVQTSRDVDA